MIKIINVILFAFMLVMNYLANALPLNGKTTGQLSAEYPNLFVPAGLTFSIWGVIYLLLLVFCIVQFFGINNEIVGKIGWLFAISCLLNGLWIFAWHYQNLPISLIIMLGLLITLILINVQLKPLPMGLFKAAFGIYLGWICIATIANTTALLVNLNWGGWAISEQIWSVLLIAIGLVITSAAIVKLNNPFLGLSVVWAFLGIAIKRNADYKVIFITALVAMVLSAIVVVYAFFRKIA
ncbi:MAG: tryptophan-rich sensory protein [Prolixibacteraceae bacterium]|nr:tryptophan-rich sensory protein [Prolixibacteraceae bacterium]